MTDHNETLRRIKENLDKLKRQSPKLYALEENDLTKHESRIVKGLHDEPLAVPAERRLALHVKRAERNQYR